MPPLWGDPFNPSDPSVPILGGLHTNISGWHKR